jgi:CsoR family transcriptional regulator, copper-sensing transcriptional repressor
MPPEVMTSRADQAEQKAKIINRLKRLEGQVRGLQNMVEEERDCHDILTLVSGIRSALNATGDIILATYLEKCQTDLKKGKADINDLVEAVRLARG